MSNNSENVAKKEKTLSKTIRNRIVGLLVLLSLILISIPSLMKKEVAEQKNAIAITQNGAVTDDKGQLVSAQEHDYNDLLDPVDDSPLKASGSAPKAETSPFDALNQNNNAQDNSASNLDVPNDNMFAGQSLEVATPISQPATVQSAPVETVENQKSEVLRSNRLTQTAPGPQKSATPTNTTAPRTVTGTKASSVPATNSALSSGSYAAQVGAFGKQAGADSMVNKLKSAGFSPIVQRVTINGKSLIKVYAGTSKNRAAVVGICQRVQAKTQVKCIVQSL